MLIYHRLAWLVLASACALARAAETEKSFLASLVENNRLLVRKTLEDRNFSEKPATIQWTDSKSGKDSTAIDAGIGLGLLSKDHPWSHAIEPLGKLEYHRNDLGAKEQNLFQAGINARWFRTYADSTHRLTADFSYKNDRVKAGQGISGSLGYAPVYTPWSIGQHRPLKSRPLLLTPIIAYQAESADGLKPTDVQGSVTRAKGSVELVWHPRKKWDKNLEVLASYAVWRNFTRSGLFKDYDRWQELFEASINVYVDDAQQFGFALGYSEGENPEKNRSRDAFTSFSVIIKLGK